MYMYPARVSSNNIKVMKLYKYRQKISVNIMKEINFFKTK